MHGTHSTIHRGGRRGRHRVPPPRRSSLSFEQLGEASDAEWTAWWGDALDRQADRPAAAARASTRAPRRPLRNRRARRSTSRASSTASSRDDGDGDADSADPPAPRDLDRVALFIFGVAS